MTSTGTELKTGTPATPAVPVTDRAGQDEDSDDESEILEESPCGRWVKRREQVRIDDFQFPDFYQITCYSAQ